MTGETFTLQGFEIQVVRLEPGLDLAFTSRGNESHWMLIGEHNEVRDVLSMLRSGDGKSADSVTTPEDASEAMRQAIDRFRTGNGFHGS